MVFIALVVFGYFSFHRLPVTLMPELNYPTLTVRTEYPGAAPREVENEISRPVEEILGVINGLNRISSISRSGVSDITLEFVWGTDMDEANQDTLEKLDQIFLPAEAERPLILRFDPALDPVLELSLSGSGPEFEGEAGLRRLRRVADLQIKRELERLPGVAAVQVRGGLEEEIHVLVDEQSLQRTGIGVQTVVDRLRQENINMAGGTIKEGNTEYMVRTLNEFTDIDQIAETILKRTPTGEIRVRDVAEVVRSHRERELVTLTDGSESVQLDIYKEAEANIVSVARVVVNRIGEAGDGKRDTGFGGRPGNERLAAQLLREEGTLLRVVADRSIFIRNSINEVRNTAILGGILAVAVLFLFLKSPVATLIASLSIPMSLLITFAPLNIFGVSLNIMSLGGLALGVGMLVDSSIVVLESIFRCYSEGDTKREAAIRGIREVRGAVIASTLTSIAVFLPMVFVEGIAGQAFGDLGIAVVISLLAALAVAIFFIPMLASRERPGFRKGEEREAGSSSPGSLARYRRDAALWRRDWRILFLPYLWLRVIIALCLELTGRLGALLVGLVLAAFARGVLPALKWCLAILFTLPARLMERLLVWVHRVYPGILGLALRHPVMILFLLMVSFATTLWVGRRLGTELLPEVHQGEFTVEINLPVGTPLDETRKNLERVEKAILADNEDIRTVLVSYGYDVTNIKRSDEGKHTARFKILLEPGLGVLAGGFLSGESTRRREERVRERIRGYLDDVPDITERVTRPVLFSSNKPVVVEIRGDDLLQLRRMAENAERLLADLPELADVETTLRQGAPEMSIIYDRQRLIRNGLGIGQVADVVRTLVKGVESTRYNLRDRRIPIIVRLTEEDRERADQIRNLTLNPGSERPIPLRSVAEVREDEGPSEIRRVDGNRVALVQANLGSASLGEAADRIEREMDGELSWPVDMDYTLAGQNKEWERSRTSLLLALGLSLFLIYVIMASQFESLVQPLIIMGSVPLAFLGSVLGLAMTGISISIVVFLGWILLIGIVVNNAIVLVDYANILRRRGLSPTEAIELACNVRLRPILMTATTTILGLLPMALGLGDGAEIRTPMAIAVICGLASSTVLTLLVIPSIYLMVARIRAALFRERGNPAS